MSTPLEILDCGGHIRITGQIVCKLWLHPKATVGFASQAVKQDLVRSLAARLEMHWDSLTEEEHGSPEGIYNFCIFNCKSNTHVITF